MGKNGNSGWRTWKHVIGWTNAFETINRPKVASKENYKIIYTQRLNTWNATLYDVFA